MDARGVKLLEAIGEAGLRAAVTDSFGRAELVALANACRVKFPGRRAQTARGDALRDELLKSFLKDSSARATIVTALERANQDLVARYATMTPGELRDEASSLPAGRAGRALFVLGELPRDTSAAAIDELRRRLGLAGGATPEASGAGERTPLPAVRSETPPAAGDEESGRLRERIRKLEAAGSDLAQAVEGMRRREAELTHEALAARKETHHLRKEMAHLEAERTRLKEEVLLLTGRSQERERAATAQAAVEDLSIKMNQLIRESRKMAHDLEERLRTKAPGSDTTRPYLDALAASVDALRREVTEVRREQEEASRRTAKAVQDLSAEAHMIRSDLAQWRKSTAEPHPRRRGDQERVGLFVDVQNMYYAARQLNARLDFGALMAAATRDRRLIRAIAYVVQNRDIDQSGFLAMLQQKNYEVRRKDLKIRHDGSSKGDWDMEMALDILTLADNLDVVVLVSGDGDFTSLVTQIKTRGPRVEVYSFAGSTAKELIEGADRHVPIDEGFLIRMSPSY